MDGLPDQPVAMLAAASHGTCFTGATSSAVDMAKAPNALGPVGNFFMATLLILLCGLSLLSTVGRQFQVSCRCCPAPVVIAATSGVALMSATFASGLSCAGGPGAADTRADSGITAVISFQPVNATTTRISFDCPPHPPPTTRPLSHQ